MKKGYRIEIQKSLTLKEVEAAKKYCDGFIKEVSQNDGNWNHLSRGGWNHGLPIARNEHGKVLYDYGEDDRKWKETDLVFRRLSKTKRIFGVVKRDLLVSKEDGKRGKEIKNSSCSCKRCLERTKVFMDNVETFVYYEVGEVKG